MVTKQFVILLLKPLNPHPPILGDIHPDPPVWGDLSISPQKGGIYVHKSPRGYTFTNPLEMADIWTHKKYRTIFFQSHKFKGLDIDRSIDAWMDGQWKDHGSQKTNVFANFSKTTLLFLVVSPPLGWVFRTFFWTRKKLQILFFVTKKLFFQRILFFFDFSIGDLVDF